MSDSVFLLILLCGVIAGLKLVAEMWLKEKKREQRRRFYRVDYLKSDDWKRKQWVVLKRDGRRLLWWASKSSSPQALCAAEYRERTDCMDGINLRLVSSQTTWPLI